MSTLVFNLSFLNWSKKGERSLLNARPSLGHCWTDMQAMFDNVWHSLNLPTKIFSDGQFQGLKPNCVFSIDRCSLIDIVQVGIVSDCCATSPYIVKHGLHVCCWTQADVSGRNLCLSDGIMASHYETRGWIRGSRCLAPVCSPYDHHNNTLGSGHPVKNVKYNWSITFFRPAVVLFTLFHYLGSEK